MVNIGPTVNAGESLWSTVGKMVMRAISINSSGDKNCHFSVYQLVVFFSSGSGVIHWVAKG